MTKLLLTGIGNALVDIEYRITEEELLAFGVRKSGMTLTAPERQHEMIAALSDRTHHRCSGGSAANTMIAFAQFGGRGAYSSLLGADDFGEFYAREFEQLGIVLRADRLQGESTGSCLVFVTPDSERTLNTTLAANVHYSRRHVDVDLIKNSEWIYVEGYKLTEESGADAVEVAAYEAKRHGTKVAVTCSDGFIVDVFGDRLKALLQHADLVFCNEGEAMALSGEGTADEAFRALSSQFGNVIVTKGEHGSLIRWNGESVHVPAYVIVPVDATGAGDMYAGAFLYGVLHGHTAELSGRLASYSAAQVVAQFGARLAANHLHVRDSVLRQHATHRD